MAKSKFQKKKDREKEVRKKILSKRAAKNAKEKENAKLDSEEKAVRPKQKPILNVEFYAAKQAREMEIRLQLEHNMKLLEGLKQEYQEELKKREEYIATLKDQSEKENVDTLDVEANCQGVDLVEKATQHLVAKAEEKQKKKRVRGEAANVVLVDEEKS